MRASVVCFSCAVLGLGSPLAAQEGAAAIDWLSDSVTGEALPGEDVVPALPGTITITPLADPSANAAGLLAPSVTGLPRALWGPADAETVAARIASVPRDLAPSAARLFRTLLLAEADSPPEGGEAILLARVDRLLDLGSLDRAGALLEASGLTTPERFRRYFDVALLEGREQEACRLLAERPDISPTYPARIFCLARGGDWAAAALTLETAATLDILTPLEDSLLARFLDAEIVDPAAIADLRPTPLTFRLHEAVGEPLSTTTLPLAFTWADLRPTRGWKAQIEAAERLARYGALDVNRLFGLYLQQRPAASGGVWERASAVRALDAALSKENSEDIEQALLVAVDALRSAGLHMALATQYGESLSEVHLADGPARKAALTLVLLSPAYFHAGAMMDTMDGAQGVLAALAVGSPEQALATDPVSQQIVEGFRAEEPPEAVRRLLREGRVGEAVLKSITLLAEGASGDLDGIAGAIATLRQLGLEETARRASIELLVADGLG